MSCKGRIDWAEVEQDTSSDEQTLPVEVEEKQAPKEPKPKEPKKWHVLKVPKERGQKEQIQQIRLQHKREQLKIIDELDREIVWLYVFKNLNPDLQKLVQKYPSLQTRVNQVGWDLKITTDQARKLLSEGFSMGTTKVFGRMQVSKRNFQKDGEFTNQKNPKSTDPQKGISEKSEKEKNSVFKKKRKTAGKSTNDANQNIPKNKQKSVSEAVIASGQDQIENQEETLAGECSGQCKKSLCQTCFEQTLESKILSINTQSVEETLTQITSSIGAERFQESILDSNEFDEMSITEKMLHQDLLKEIDIPSIPERSLISQSDKSLPEISMIEGISTIMMMDDEDGDDDMNLQLNSELSEIDKVKKKKRIRNKQPKEKKVSNNPFDRLR